jgi:hypothetical protein
VVESDGVFASVTHGDMTLPRSNLASGKYLVVTKKNSIGCCGVVVAIEGDSFHVE